MTLESRLPGVQNEVDSPCFLGLPMELQFEKTFKILVVYTSVKVVLTYFIYIYIYIYIILYILYIYIILYILYYIYYILYILYIHHL